MNVELNYEQRARLELIAMHAGKSPAQVLMEAAQSLLNREVGDYELADQQAPQQFLREEELEARLARILRH
jgi:predicted DNA-binding protein